MVGQTCRSLPGSWVNCGPYWPGSRGNSGLIGPAAGWIAFAYNLQLWGIRAVNLDSGNPHDGRADKNPYPQDRRAGKDSYPHDSDNQCIIIRLQLSFMMINVQLMLVYLILFYSLISARFCNKYVLKFKWQRFTFLFLHYRFKGIVSRIIMQKTAYKKSN